MKYKSIIVSINNISENVESVRDSGIFVKSKITLTSAIGYK
jgi:hypothetical protein